MSGAYFNKILDKAINDNLFLKIQSIMNKFEQTDKTNFAPFLNDNKQLVLPLNKYYNKKVRMINLVELQDDIGPFLSEEEVEDLLQIEKLMNYCEEVNNFEIFVNDLHWVNDITWDSAKMENVLFYLKREYETII